MTQNAQKLADRNSATDLLKAFLLKEVEFRLDSQFVTAPKLSKKQKAELIDELACDLLENSDDLFNYDVIDARLQTNINDREACYDYL